MRNLGDELWLAIEQNREADLNNLILGIQNNSEKYIIQFNIERISKNTNEQYKIAQKIVLTFSQNHAN